MKNSGTENIVIHGCGSRARSRRTFEWCPARTLKFSRKYFDREYYSQSSCKIHARRLIICRGRGDEYRNLNFLDAPSSVTIDIQKG